jgi:hypothetical protein
MKTGRVALTEARWHRGRREPLIGTYRKKNNEEEKGQTTDGCKRRKGMGDWGAVVRRWNDGFVFV